MQVLSMPARTAMLPQSRRGVLGPRLSANQSADLSALLAAVDERFHLRITA